MSDHHDNHELTELLKSFMAYSAKRGFISFPPLLFRGSKPWHIFLSELRGMKTQFRALKCIGEPYINTKEQDFFQISGWDSVAANFLVADVTKVSESGTRDILAKQFPISRKYPKNLLEKMFEVASNVPGFFKKP